MKRTQGRNNNKKLQRKSQRLKGNVNNTETKHRKGKLQAFINKYAIRAQKTIKIAQTQSTNDERKST